MALFIGEMIGFVIYLIVGALFLDNVISTDWREVWIWMVDLIRVKKT